MKLIKLIIYSVALTLVLSSCQSVKEGLSGKRSSKSEEFLVKKKNPLVLPPDYNDLPKPQSENDDTTNNNDQVVDIQKILGQISDNDKKIDIEDKSLEEKILREIKKN